MLPTGSPLDHVAVRRMASQLISRSSTSATPSFFAGQANLVLKGPNFREILTAVQDVLQILEEVRAATAENLGLVANRKDATRLSPGLPKVAFVAPPRAYRTTQGREISPDAHNDLKVG